MPCTLYNVHVIAFPCLVCVSFNLDIPLDDTGAVLHKFCLFSTDINKEGKMDRELAPFSVIAIGFSVIFFPNLR